MNQEQNNIRINACLRTSTDELKKSISLLPNMHLIKNANAMKYDVLENINGKPIPTVELDFGNEYIEIISKAQNAVGISKTMLLIKFLSILAYVKQYYDINLFDLYSNIVEALQSSIFFEKRLNSNLALEKLKNQLEALNFSNISLSEGIVNLQNINKENSEHITLFKEFFAHISDSLKINMNTNDVRLSESLSSFGIGTEMYKKIGKFLYDTKSDKK